MWIFLAYPVLATEYHVSPTGSDQNEGTNMKPLKTISAAAQRARAGDVITVHEGTYRERINPPYGGTSDSKRIVYQATPGEDVIIKGSEVIKNWQKVEDDVWKVIIPNTFFGNYNPYQDLIEGDWFDGLKRDHHTGEVFLNGKSLYEKTTLDEVIKPVPYERSRDEAFSVYIWYCESDDQNTVIWANFQGADPNNELVEISVRETCFYPAAPGRNYITVRGFHLTQAATQWAAPTAEQIGLIGTHWSKGWIIENNIISNAKCTGLTLGKDRATGHNVWLNNRSKGGATHYNEVIFRARQIGWSKETIGSHIVRNNTIFDCGQAGICGSLGAVYSTITNNHIYDIWTKRQFQGAEIGGIKLHAAIDVIIKKNHIHNAGRGLWMDWMAQGTRISQNLCYDNTIEDLFFEVDHGPFMADNNIFLSEYVLKDLSEGGAYVHNLFAGKIKTQPSVRYTPYHFAHSTGVAGVVNIIGGDDRFYNNIFVGVGETLKIDTEARQKIGYGLDAYNTLERPMYVEGNIYLNQAKPYIRESVYIEKPETDPKVKLMRDGTNISLQITLDPSFKKFKNQIVTTDWLGTTLITELPFENRDGSPIKIDYDYFGEKRNAENPMTGPFESPGKGELVLKVWEEK